jgi:Cu-processing system ATP-binding protein
LIKISNLNKSFGKHQVLFDVNINIEKGMITSVGGPNGSGKTTLIKSILGLVNFEVGDILVDNLSIKENDSYKNIIGYMPQIGRYPDNLTINEVLNMIIDVRNNIPNRKDELIEIFNLQDFLKKQMRTLSGGTRQKVSAIIALMFSPEILILDEPTSGLDPISSQRLKELILIEKQKNKTILIISHNLNEIEELSNNFAYILEGKVLIDDSISNITSGSEKKSLEKSIAELIMNK